MDVTRPVVANCILPSASYESGYTDALDIVGFSYRQVVYDYCHENYPDKPILGTEISVNGMNGKRSWKESLYLVSLSGQVWIILVKLDVEIHGRLKELAAD